MADDEGMDDRFKKVLTDPRFKRLPSRKKKIQIDSRFEGMFDKQFNGEPLIDKRGRKVKNTANDGLKRFYEIVDDGEKPGVSDMARKLRGEDNDENSSSSDESSSEEEDEEHGDEEEQTESGNLAEKDVPRSDEITCRLAVTNVDWDRLKAVDLFVLLNSFKPNEGEIISVKIYPSQFGKERMEKEKIEGPKELTDVKLGDDEEDPYALDGQDADDIINTGVPFVSEKLRQYQINRLKYFYAVVECDKPETAAVIYDQLDGLEYESSASTLDLRFIPDEMTFDDDEPDSICLEMPSLIDYNPPNFITTALQQTKVNLTWDETDPKRAKTLQRAFTERDKISDDLACYLASSSSEGEGDEDDYNDYNEGGNDDDGISEEDDTNSLDGKSVQDRISKYKDLLRSVEEEDAAEDEKDIDMEIKWEPELENIGKKIVEEKAKKSMTIFEKQMAERKAKKKETGNKKQTKSSKDKQDEYEDEESDENIDDNESSDDDQEQSNYKEESDEDNSEIDDDNEADKDNLALLVLDNEKEDKKHFNYEDFVENKKSRRKRKKKEKPKQEEDNFEFDEVDPRFKAIYDSHLYNIDQSSSHFKKTQAYDKILKRKSSKDPDEKFRLKRSK